METKHIFIATALDFPDAIAGGVLAARHNSGVLLVRGNRDEPNQVVQNFLIDRDINEVTLFGGAAAIKSEMELWFKAELDD